MSLSSTVSLTKTLFRSSFPNLYFRDYIYPEQAAPDDTTVTNIRVLYPPQRVLIAPPASDPFVPISKYYSEGWVDRPSILVCDIPDAHFHVASGLVCTRTFQPVADFGLGDRVCNYRAITKRRPLAVKRLTGDYSSINYCFAGNFWHWMLDCLPRIHSLARTSPRSPVTILMPESANDFQRETLRCVIPGHFKIDYLSGHEWVKTERFIWPSLISCRAMGLLPPEYYDAIRRPIFRNYQLSNQHRKTERLYISREGTGRRRVTNEDEVMRLLEPYGFRKLIMTGMPFREQVELFHNAEIIIGPHGAGMGGMFFSGDIDVVVLYASRPPSNYFHTLAVGLGQRHHHVCHDMDWEDNDFATNIPELERVLTQDLGLKVRS